MKNICLYFQVHQPLRLKHFRFFDISQNLNYFDDKLNQEILQKVAEKCYLPANKLLLELIKKHKGKFKVTFSLSGIVLEQFEMYAPQVLDSFKKLAATGNVEFLAETYAHSLASVISPAEFKRQVALHSAAIEKHFGQKPSVFRNTELIYNNYTGSLVHELGYKAMLAEGVDWILGWQSPNFMYKSATHPELKLLLKNHRLSDDIAFRFQDRAWSEWPLTAEKYVGWLNNIPTPPQIVNLFMDYETFGEHQWADSGIFEFLKLFPDQVLKNSDFNFVTPSEAVEKLEPINQLDIHTYTSWADENRDLTAWLGNPLQDDAYESLYRLEEKILKCQDENIQKEWLYLQSSDHFYYMCTKYMADGDVHKYFSPYKSPYDAFINYMNVLVDFEEKLNIKLGLNVMAKDENPPLTPEFKRFIPEGIL